MNTETHFQYTPAQGDATVTKHEQLYHALRTEVIEKEPGDSFDSFRAIMQGHAVSQATATKAIQRLVDEGFLEKTDRRGMQITERVLKYREGNTPVLCLAVPQWQSDWYAMIEHHFAALADELGYDLEVYRYEWSLKVPRTLPPWKIDALVVITDVPALTREDLGGLADFHIPFVIFGRDLSGVAVHCLTSDDEYAGAQAAHHLYDLGHRRLGVVLSQPRSESVMDRVRGFVKFIELHGPSVEVIDCGIRAGDFAPAKVYETLRRRFARSGPDVTGLFTLCEDSSAAIYRVCAELKLRIPHDISVVGIGESWRVEYLTPPLTAIFRDVGALVRETLAILRARPDNDTPFIHKLVKPRLVVRASTAAPRA